MKNQKLSLIRNSKQFKTSNSMRKQHLSDAAFIALINFGLRNATYEKIADIAGVSKATVLHYYKDKDSIFVAVLLRANSILRDCVIDLINHADNDWEKLYAIILGNFSPVVFNKEICSAWLSLCAEAPYNDQCQRLQTIIHSRMHSNLKSVLKTIINEEDLELTTQTISDLIDGIWTQAGLQVTAISPEQALEKINFCIASLIPVDGPQADIKRQAYDRMLMVESIMSKTKIIEMNRRFGFYKTT